MTDQEFIDKGLLELAERNSKDREHQQQLAQADIRIAEQQRACQDAAMELRKRATARDLLAGERSLNKAEYGLLYEKVGQAQKRVNAAQAAERETVDKAAVSAREGTKA